MDEPVRVTVHLELGEGLDEVDRADALQRLTNELRDVPVDLEVAEEAPPPGAKGIGASMGEIALLGAGASLEVGLGVAVDWFRRQRSGHRFRIEGPNGMEVVLPDVAPDEALRLIGSWFGTTDVSPG